jgi:hypothetical protein
MNRATQTTNLPRRLRRRFERTLDKLTRNNYGATKARYQRRTARGEGRAAGQLPLLIYTMGKVGSSSVLHSLKLLPDLGRPLYHLHSLSPESLRELEVELKPAFPDPQAMVSLHHVWRCQYVVDKLAAHPEERVQAITLVRDPLARNLSDFFQHIQVEPLPDAGGVRRWKLVAQFHDFEITVGEDDVSALIELYFEKEWHDFPPLWIDRELEGVLGIDVYATPFPREQGYAIYHSRAAAGRRADLLLIRLRDLNRCASQALPEFLGLDAFTLVNANVAEKKEYVDVYRAFKSAIAFPASFLDEMYSSKLVQHFYSSAEIQALRDQWSKTDG